MKHLIKSLLMVATLLALPLTFTSCEDILGEWSKPTPATAGGGSSTINATSLALDAILRLDKTTPKALTPTVTPSDAAITWESSDEAVATVDATGKVTPIAAGTVTIKATSGDLSATSTVYVYDEIHNINDGGSVVVGDDESCLIEGNGTAVANSITIGEGGKVTLKGINITQQILCTGDATIILADGSENTVDVSTTYDKAGIKGGDTGTLTIEAETAGTGKLTAKGGEKAAGIGTGEDQTCGAITINGGVIKATGGGFFGGAAAGIGTGDTLNADNKCGAITINGGTITAQGGWHGAGIGTGYVDNNYKNTCGAITINGGTITAQGGWLGAGIGTGYAGASSGDATAECGNITINGGTVNATGGYNAAGIGTGLANTMSSKTASQTCGNITIGTGVTSVIATKGDSSPNSIGKGYNDGGTQACGTITIGGDATTYAAGVATSPFTYPEP